MTLRGEAPTPPAPSREQALALVRRYHELTKHTAASVYGSGHVLDWENQPDPFRRYEGAPLVPLSRAPAFPDVGTFQVLDRLAEREGASPPITPEVVSSLLFHALAVSAWKQLRDDPSVRWSLRVNPSSGNLHPIEAYVVVPAGAVDLEPGLYHYRADVHALERRCGPELYGMLERAAGAGAALFVVLTSIAWREAWKYRARALRYCLLDGGHAAGAVVTAARALGFASNVTWNFDDVALARGLGVFGGDEEPVLVIALGARSTSATPASHEGARRDERFVGTPNALSSDVVEYTLIDEASNACATPGIGAQPVRAASEMFAGADEIVLPRVVPRDDRLAQVVRRRRSAVAFDGKERLAFEGFAALMHHAQARWNADWFASDRAPLLTLVAYVHRVDGVEPGAYAWRPRQGALVRIHAGDQRAWAAGLSLGQEIASHGVVAFSMIADLERAFAHFGARGYRAAHIEAGFVGQCLYLGAEALGLEATGIGAFFDDDVHRRLGLIPAQGQVVYHFTVGRSVRDERIVEPGDPFQDPFTSPPAGAS